jgi:hypothetical protein
VTLAEDSTKGLAVSHDSLKILIFYRYQDIEACFRKSQVGATTFEGD